MITKQQTIADCYGDDMELTMAFEDFSENIRYSEMELFNYNVSYSIRLDSLIDDKQGNKLVIKID